MSIEKILVTGAAGKTGQAIIRALAKRNMYVRALIYQSDQDLVVRSAGADETISGDMRSEQVLLQALQEVKLVYHICPNMSPHELEIGKTLISAAQKTGLERIVYHSVLHPQVEDMPHHWQKLRMEEQLFKSELPFTILQPAAYMQNVLGYWRSMLEVGIFSVPYSVDAPQSMVDLEDVAEAAARVITEAGHEFATYELCGLQALSARDVAEAMSRLLEKPVQAVRQDPHDWEQKARASGMDEQTMTGLLKMFAYYDNFGFTGNPHVLTWLLGRPPRQFDEFVRHYYTFHSG